MKAEPTSPSAATDPLVPRVFAVAFGLLLGLCLLKFGNPPITEKWVTAPSGFWEFLIACPWPISWVYGLLAIVSVAGLLAVRRNSAAPGWLLVLPLAWAIWQFVAAERSVDAALSAYTVKHLAACAVCFYLGYFSLSHARHLGIFWAGLLLGFLIVLAVAWEQQFGGLKESRRYFFLYLYPQMKEVSPDYLKKITSDRIFATLFYPNALAGALLLLLPVTLGVIGQLRTRLTPSARWFLIGLITAASLACLYWSGSKGGWLLMLFLGLVWLLRLRFSQRLKVALVAAVLLVGLTGFFWKYAAFFRKGATSVSARFDYWQAALATARSNPVLGTGPGTFAIAYEKIKKPESEMARLVHNDYLEQASDSGWLGFLLYTGFIAAALVLTYPAARSTAGTSLADWPAFGVWLGVLGWSLQGLFEFGLYLPALAWPAFTFLGCLLGRRRCAVTPAGNAD